MPSIALPSLSRSDHEREARITELSRKIDRCLKAGMKLQAHEYWRALCAEIHARTMAQIAHMEAARGLR